MVQPKEGDKTMPTPILQEVKKVLGEFNDIISDGEPATLPPKKSFSHYIDFIPRASLPNMLAKNITLEEKQEVVR